MQRAHRVRDLEHARHPARLDPAQQPRQRLREVERVHERGPRRSVSEPGTLRSMPGSAIGIEVSVLIRPEFPKEAPPPGASGSITVTGRPARCRYSAVESPTTPAPSTSVDATRSFMSPSVLDQGAWKLRQPLGPHSVTSTVSLNDAAGGGGIHVEHHVRCRAPRAPGWKIRVKSLVRGPVGA